MILTFAVRIVPHSVIVALAAQPNGMQVRRRGTKSVAAVFASISLRTAVRFVRVRFEPDSNQNGYRRMHEPHECVKWHKLKEFRQCLGTCLIILFRVPFSEETNKLRKILMILGNWRLGIERWKLHKDLLSFGRIAFPLRR